MKSKIAITVMAAASVCTQVHADSSYDAKGVISESQLDTVVATLLRIAPSGTKATNLELQGFFTVNADRYLTVLDVNAVQFKVTTKVGIIPVSSNVTISIAGTFPNLDCNNPQITRVSVTGTNFLLDGEIRKHVEQTKESLLRDNFVAQTDLVKYCKVKPTPHIAALNEDAKFNFELVSID